MQLFSQTYPPSYSPSRDSSLPVLIIPGLFGSTTNWRGFAKQLGEHCPVIVIDQRNHGRSPHADSHCYSDMVGDLLEFIDNIALEQINLCGHSMGGKVAMAFALIHSERVNSLAVLDIAPVEYSHTHAPYLEEMIELDLNLLQSRSAAEQLLKDAIPDTSTRLFLLQSLAGTPGKFHWRLNLSVLLRDMPKILSFPFSQLAGLSHTGNTLFVSGEKSDYLLESHHNQIRESFPTAHFKAISKAGHWLHVEQPQAVLESLLNFLQIGKNND
ncbi:MAG: alpha/beta fold hydrolase [Arenicella sp.]|nr:alpha/beta fold hydrolase [Arenicella sp.]